MLFRSNQWFIYRRIILTLKVSKIPIMDLLTMYLIQKPGKACECATTRATRVATMRLMRARVMTTTGTIKHK